jgi:peptidoglycan/xylan/chitin deacetylase (PgdA/CDA1 family)
MCMRERLRILIAGIFYYSGITYLSLWIKGQSARQLLILNYHNAGGNLSSQLRYLSRHYRIMHLETALEELYAPKPVRIQDRRLPLVLTFDDGYLDNYTDAFQLAQRYRIPLTIFIIPGYVESGHYFWWLAAAQIVKQLQTEQVLLNGQLYQLTHAEGRRDLIRSIDHTARYASSVAERETFLLSVQQTFGVVLPTRSQQPDNPNIPLTWEQMREMEATGWISFGAHTVNHPLLAHLSDPDEVMHEVQDSRLILEEKLGHSIQSFAYPVGKWQHIGAQGIEAVKSAGYKWAVTTFEAENTCATDPLLLARMPGDINLHWLVMAAELVGLLGVVSRIRKKYAKLFKK